MLTHMEPIPPIVQRRLRRLHVIALYIFGSRARGDAHALSDYDYAVLLPEGHHARGGPLYMQFYDLLSDISPRTLDNDILDIVFLRRAPLELQSHIIRHGRILFETDPKARANFEAMVTLRYCDYRPILDEMDRTILHSL